MVFKVNYMYFEKITFNDRIALDSRFITMSFYFIISILLGWCSLALSTMLQQKCSPAVPLSQWSRVQLRSGRWKESCLPQPVWLLAKLLERCWHIDACRLGSTEWCTGRFPGHTALTLWVQAPPEAPLSHDMLRVYVFNLSQIQSFRAAMKEGGIILSEPRRKYVGTWFLISC